MLVDLLWLLPTIYSSFFHYVDINFQAYLIDINIYYQPPSCDKKVFPTLEATQIVEIYPITFVEET